MERRPFIATYRNCPLFQNLNDEEIQEILEHGHNISCIKGQLLMQQGDVPEYLYFIMDGGLIAFRGTSDGTIRVVRLMRSGDSCAEAVAFIGSKSPVGLQAVERSELLAINKSFVLKYAFQNLTFAGNMLQILAKNYADVVYRIPVRSAVQRVGYFLLQRHLADKSESFVIRFNRYIVASYLGMSFETLSRALATVKKMGIEISGRRVTLPCKCLLCAFCDERTAADCPISGAECEELKQKGIKCITNRGIDIK